MSGGYALVDDVNPTFYTLDDIAKVTEECFINCYGTNLMYLPPQNYNTLAYDEDQEHSHLVQPILSDNLLLEVQDIRLTKIGRIMMRARRSHGVIGVLMKL